MHSFILSGISTNKSELIEVNGYIDIAVNYESANNFWVLCFTYVPYTLQEDE